MTNTWKVKPAGLEHQESRTLGRGVTGHKRLRQPAGRAKPDFELIWRGSPSLDKKNWKNEKFQLHTNLSIHLGQTSNHDKLLEPSISRSFSSELLWDVSPEMHTWKSFLVAPRFPSPCSASPASVHVVLGPKDAGPPPSQRWCPCPVNDHTAAPAMPTVFVFHWPSLSLGLQALLSLLQAPFLSASAFCLGPKESDSCVCPEGLRRHPRTLAHHSPEL